MNALNNIQSVVLSWLHQLAPFWVHNQSSVNLTLNKLILLHLYYFLYFIHTQDAAFQFEPFSKKNEK